MLQKRVFVIDDHPLFRNGVVRILSDQEGIVVKGEAGSIEEAIYTGALGETDLLLLDLSLGNVSSLDFIKQLQQDYSNLKIIILTMHNKPFLIKKAVNLGVDGFIVKDSPQEVLISALYRVFDGEKYLDSALSGSLFQCLTEVGETRVIEDNLSLYGSLSKREQQIFRLMAEGQQNDQIAQTLFISKKTVENYRSKIMAKLNLESLTQLLSYADQLGVIS